MTEPQLVRAFVLNQWRLVTLAGHWYGEFWFVEGHGLPRPFLRANGRRRTAVCADRLTDLQGRPLDLPVPSPEREECEPGPSREVSGNHLPSAAAVRNREPVMTKHQRRRK
jgi:hypothetical protein